MIFDGCLLLADIDGTLATYDRKIVPANIKGAQYFIDNGGYFAVATGRTAFSTKNATKGLPMNCPSVVVNGGGLYDIQNDNMLFSCGITHDIVKHFNDVVDISPNIGIEINVEGILHCIKYSPRSEEHILYECGSFHQYTLNDIPDDSQWLKALFTGAREDLDPIEAFLKKEIPADASYYTVRSEETLLELLPAEATKGKGLLRLAKHLGINPKDTYAIGDYYNDIDLLKTAGYSAAVAEAPQEVIAVTDYVACPCGQGAVADFIKHIESLRNK